MSIKRFLTIGAIALVAVLTMSVSLAAADTYTTGLESPNFTTGSVNGQNGWHSYGAPPWLVSYDQEVVNDSTYGGQVPPVSPPSPASSFGTQSLRLSNWVTEATGEFAGQTYSPSTPNAAGEGQTNKVFDGTFQFIPTKDTFQPGLEISVSPDNGSGGRMSYVDLKDVNNATDGNGILIRFWDPVNGYVTAGTYDRTKVHTIRFLIEFKPGADNDVVRFYVDGVDIGQRDGLCLTTWESFYGSAIPATDSFEFRADNSVNLNGQPDCDLNGATNPVGNSCVVPTLDPSTGPHGYLFDNVTTITRNTDPPAGCGAVITGGQITPTGTTCTAYNGGTAATLGTVYYTLKNGTINSVSPGVFFYYGKISGAEGDQFTIDQTGSPTIPIQKDQVILYDTNCNVVKGWTPDLSTPGEVSGTLPSTGTFIISAKYDPGALKGKTDPGTVTYTIDGTTVTLQKK